MRINLILCDIVFVVFSTEIPKISECIVNDFSGYKGFLLSNPQLLALRSKFLILQNKIQIISKYHRKKKRKFPPESIAFKQTTINTNK